MTRGILWEGPSPFDGSPIVCIVTESENRKTGKVLQTWILPADTSPSWARKTGRDEGVCGRCPLRLSMGGGCYVGHEVVANVGRTYLRGGYRPITVESLRGYVIRWGAYGDPAMLPESLVRAVNAVASGHLGYTHQWRYPWAQWARGVFMASVDTPAQEAKAQAAGWGTYRVLRADSADLGDTLPCPSRQGVTCADCGMCDGRRLAIGIPAHGALKNRTVAHRLQVIQ